VTVPGQELGADSMTDVVNAVRWLHGSRDLAQSLQLCPATDVASVRPEMHRESDGGPGRVGRSTHISRWDLPGSTAPVQEYG